MGMQEYESFIEYINHGQQEVYKLLDLIVKEPDIQKREVYAQAISEIITNNVRTLSNELLNNIVTEVSHIDKEQPANALPSNAIK